MIQFDKPTGLDTKALRGLSKPVTGYAQNFQAAVDKFRYNDQSQSEGRILQELWGPIVDQVNELYPEENFVDPGAYLNRGLFSATATRGKAQADYEWRANQIIDFLNKNQQSLPDNLQGITLDSLNQQASDQARAAQEYFEEISSRSRSTSGSLGTFVGGVVGVIDDPVLVSSMAMGASRSAGILKLAFTEAFLGAGVTAITETAVMDWYKKQGYDYSYQDFLRNVGFATVASAALPVGLRISTATAKSGFDAMAKAGRANSDSKLLKDLADAAENMENDNPFQNSQFAPAQAEHTKRVVEADAAINNNRAPNIVDEPTVPVDPGTIAASTDNLNGVMFSVPAKDVLIDAKRFQFKEGGDEYGVTERLQGVKEWDQVKAGTVVFWEDVDGKIFIADGHQRAGLARRIMDQDPKQNIDLIGYKLREVDDISAEKARVIAAVANIAQGTGTAIDAAKILRVEPGRLAELPPRSSLVRQAKDLVELSEEAFGAIINGVIPSNYGAIVGRLIKDPGQQQAAIQVLAKSDPSNAFQAEAIVRQVKETDVVKEVQTGLFGDELVSESLYLERAKVLDRTYKMLRADKASFENLSRNAERIEAAGNKLVTSQNKRRADQNAQAITLLQALATRKGTLSDELTEAARTARDTNNYAAAARSFSDSVRRGIERGDFDRAEAGDVGRPFDDTPQSSKDAIEDEPSLEGFDEPSGKAAEDQTNQLVTDTFREVEEAVEPNSLANLKFLLGTNPTREQINNHPAVINALREMESRPETITASNYGTPEWHQSRVYNIEGDQVVGTESALLKFEQQAEALAYKELGLSPGTIARNKEVTIVLGPPAAGKSTIANEIAVANRSAILDSDEIKKTLPEFEGGKGTGAVHEESSTLSKALQDIMISRGTNITLPKVGHSTSSIRKAVSLYKEKGYKVRLLLMDVTPENAVNRMLGRFVETGRFIPLSYLDAVGTRPAETFKALRKENAADGYAKIDNNGGFKDPKTVSGISGDNPLKGSRFDIPSGGRTGPGALRRSQSDSEGFELEIGESELDLEIPVDMRVIDDEIVAETRTLRDIKTELDAEDALINRLGVCSI